CLICLFLFKTLHHIMESLFYLLLFFRSINILLLLLLLLLLLFFTIFDYTLRESLKDKKLGYIV
ncbi:MAG: hypothetical protein K7J15_04470, partial [Candidatus Regiella insecticola]|nr:hypothetical protein [Candidatus Regiella insecticola]